MNAMVMGLVGLLITALTCGPAAAWSHAGRWGTESGGGGSWSASGYRGGTASGGGSWNASGYRGGSASGGEGSWSATGTHGDTATHTAGSGSTTVTNPYGGSATHYYGEGTTVSNASGTTAYASHPPYYGAHYATYHPPTTVNYYGSGAADLQTAVEGYLMTEQGLRRLGSGDVDAEGGKAPGVAVPLVVVAESGNPIGLIVGGAVKAGGEVTGKSTIEGAAKRTAKEIADQLRVAFQKQGWI